MKTYDYKYKIPPVEKAINHLVKFIFYYRLVMVVWALVLITCTGVHIYRESTEADKLKNSAVIVTCGSVIIGIFYSILNYEHTRLRFKYDVKASRETLTFTSSCKMHDAATIAQFRLLKDFYVNNKALFIQADYLTIQQRMEENPDARTAFILLFNYFEGIAIGLQQGIMEEDFVKEFFKAVFVEYHTYYAGYMKHLRNEARSRRVFLRFTQVAEKWQNEN